MSSGEDERAALHQLTLRPAEEGDCELLWKWRNEENTRKWSFDGAYIPYEEHKNWFLSKLNSADSLILIVSDKSKRDIGQVRFDKSPDGSAEVGISIIDMERDKGYGSSALRLACKYALGKLNITRVIAHIKGGNKASIKAFTKAGFINRGSLEFKGHKAIEMQWEQKFKATAARKYK